MSCEVDRTLVLDLAGCRRCLQRPPAFWSRIARGDLREAADLLWDAASTLEDEQVADSLQHGVGHHAYEYLWGNREDMAPMEERVAAWDSAVGWFGSRLSIADRHDRRFARRR